MGVVHAEVVLANPSRADLAAISVEALVDTGATHLCIPAHVSVQLELGTGQPREVTLADGSVTTAPYVGPIELRFANRACFVGAMVLGDEVLLGAIPMEDLDLVVHPRTGQLAVPAAAPNLARALAK